MQSLVFPWCIASSRWAFRMHHY